MILTKRLPLLELHGLKMSLSTLVMLYLMIMVTMTMKIIIIALFVCLIGLLVVSCCYLFVFVSSLCLFDCRRKTKRQELCLTLVVFVFDISRLFVCYECLFDLCFTLVVTL